MVYSFPAIITLGLTWEGDAEISGTFVTSKMFKYSHHHYFELGERGKKLKTKTTLVAQQLFFRPSVSMHDVSFHLEEIL